MSQFNEVFSKYVTEKLYQSNAFLAYTKNVSEYATGKIVHIPQYTFTGTIGVDGANFTGATSFDTVRTIEQDLTFTLNEYHFVTPIHVTDFDDAMTNYNKMQVTFGDAVNTLVDNIAKRVLNKWALGVPSTKVVRTTSATAGVANNPAKNASRKITTFTDIVALAQKFDEDNLPDAGRYLLLDPQMYNELLKDPQVINALNLGKATLPSGVIGELAGINIMKKNTISTADTAGAVKTFGFTPADTDNRVGIAWHESVLVRAEAPMKIYQLSSDPYKRGSVFNASIYMGAVNPRIGADDAGVYLLIQQ